MQRIICKSKIQRLRVTDKNLNYEGSLTLDEELMNKADLLEGEMILIINVNNGKRFITYIMKGEKDSGVVCLNGGTARLGEIGDELILISYCLMDTIKARDFEIKKVFVDEKNRPIK